MKIDRSFIDGMATNESKMTIVSTMVSLGRDLNLRVIAEGVETEEQARLLRMLHCDEIQGYYFSRPEPAADCTRALEEGLTLRQPNAVHWLTRQA